MNKFPFLKQRLVGLYPVGPEINGIPELGFRDFNFCTPIQKEASNYINTLEKIILKHVNLGTMVDESEIQIYLEIEKEKNADLFLSEQKDK